MLGAPLNQYIYPILFQVQQCFSSIYEWVYFFLNSIFGSSGVLSPLKPLFVVGIAVSIIFVSITFIKKVVWGR